MATAMPWVVCFEIESVPMAADKALRTPKFSADRCVA